MEERWEALCNEQGWDAEAQVALLEGYISNQDSWATFIDYAIQAAEEENSQSG